MIRFLFAGCAMIALPGASIAQHKAPAPREIVVTGVRLSDSAAALRACIERHCPPDQDIAAALAHAENLFVAGDYHAARQTLGRAIGRDKRFAATYPIPVSNLLRANANVALHLGEGDGYRIGTLDMVDALKAGLPADDARILAAQIEVGDSLARLGRGDAAISNYRSIEKRADERGLVVLAAHARLRIAVLYVAMALETPQNYAAGARRAIDALATERDPRLANFVLAAKVLRTKLATKAGDSDAVDRLVDDFRGMHNATPILLFSPGIKLREHPYRLTEQLGGNGTVGLLGASGGNELARRSPEDFEEQWVDVGFWVSPSGKVSDAAVLRQSPHLDGDWVNPVITSVSGRRYAPLALDPADPGIFRVERYTFTSYWEDDKTGTHLRTRSTTPRVEILDLSLDRAAPAKNGDLDLGGSATVAR